MNAFLRLLLLCSLTLALPHAAQAHASSQAYLELSEAAAGHSALRVDLALRDLDAALDLDLNADGQLTWGEVKAARPAIERYVLAGLALKGCSAGFSAQAFELTNHADGSYARLYLEAPCALPEGSALRYTLLGEVDPMHRALLKTARGPAMPEVRLLNPRRPASWPVTATPTAEPASPLSASLADAPHSPPPPPVDTAATPAGSASLPPHFWLEGITHLLTGYDHLLFLLCLLLPAVLKGQAVERRPVGRAREALWPVLGIVSAFTVSHSITLGLAALGWVRIPPAVIEPLIAASIVLAALDNLKPFLQRLLGLPRWGVAGAFGLIHGFGFAGALAELDLPPQTLAWALLQFNLGLEAAQVGVVLVAGSLLLRLRHSPRYPRWVLGLGSLCSAGIGSFWVVQRLV